MLPMGGGCGYVENKTSWKPKCIFSQHIKAKSVRGNSRQCHLKVYSFCATVQTATFRKPHPHHIAPCVVSKFRSGHLAIFQLSSKTIFFIKNVKNSSYTDKKKTKLGINNTIASKYISRRKLVYVSYRFIKYIPVC